MSQENVELVRSVYDAVGRRDAASVLALYDPDVEWDSTRGPMRDLMGGPTVYHGHDELRRWFREWYEAWENVEANVEELIDAGDQVIAVLNYRGRGRVSGVEVELTAMAGVWTIRKGKIVRVVWFGSRAEAFEAVGLAE
ncbi:MAG TPA: nuclear transport factor 2 family protein [Solirubrobacteraceae bacterium]|nr:nuclear transport factor 2 family protein [Solirubrobacteraceae bacterium]